MKLMRDDDGYWYWEDEHGNESPIFCVKELALRWKRDFLSTLRAEVKRD